MTTALAHREQPQGGALAMWDAEQVHVLRTLICPDANDAEFVLFGQVCQRTGLDPFSRQVYGIKRKGKLTIQTSIDGFRLIAQRSKDYAGQEGPFWCGEDGVWRDVWLSREHPSAAKVGVYRKGWTQPVWGVATWAEYAQYFSGQPGEMWARMPANMLAKCAESQALRKAFPAELSGLYSRDEMDQSDNDAKNAASEEPTPIRVDEINNPPPPVGGWSQGARARWENGLTKAAQIGAGAPTEPPSTASRDEILTALKTLAANITAREALLKTLHEVIEVANANDGSFEVPGDIFQWSDDQVREWTGQIQESIDQEGLPE